jgi:hypothetical protein
MPQPDPFPDFSSTFWSFLDPNVIASEDLVSKMHTIELLENLSPYRGVTDPYFQRVWHALDALQRFGEVKAEWITAALVIFGNAIYFPQALLDDAWRGLYRSMVEGESATLDQVEASLDFQIFENDPSGMAGAFCHLNRLQGRLDHEKYPRVASTDELADLLLDFINPLKRNDARITAHRLFSKDVWALLVDKTLSGHSLSSDVTRMLTAYRIAIDAGIQPPRIVILAQIMTASAEKSLRARISEGCEELGLAGTLPIKYYRAVYLDGTHNITSKDTRLVNNKALLRDIRDLCRWFAAKFLARNPDFDRMRERSGDNLHYGYRACGLTIADYQNCPTDSLPILWHLSEIAGSAYRGPYVRIHSRIGPQLTDRSTDKWKMIRETPEITRQLCSSFAKAKR